jgi:hypothetical protein
MQMDFISSSQISRSILRDAMLAFSWRKDSRLAERVVREHSDTRLNFFLVSPRPSENPLTSRWTTNSAAKT